MIYEVIFDLETKSFFDETGRTDPAELGVSVVSVYKRQLDEDLQETAGEMFSFWEGDFGNMWPIFEQADRIIGFNSVRFDARALFPYAPSGFDKYPHFDILDKIREVHGKRVSLNRVAVSTLGRGKVDSGANAVKYWKSQTKKDLAKLKYYCEEDVAITRDVYDHGLKYGELKFIDYWNTPFEIKVDFGYPADFSPKSEKPQMGLF
jgi:DEAD/DEAH box helicase domain-containing protein